MSLRSGKAFARRVIVFAVLGALCAGGMASPNADPEDELKAAAVLSFLRYSELLATPDGSITIGILGRPAFEQVASRLLSGKLINNRVVRVKEVKPGGDPQGCQLLYFATNSAADIKPFLANPRYLTIGENDRFLDQGGAVNFFIADGRIAFEVSLEAVNRSGVTIASNLMRLGQIRTGGAGRPHK